MNTTMKALIATKYGSADVLRLAEVEKPTPQDNQVLVEVHAVAVNTGDIHLLGGKPFLVRLMGYGLLKPKNPILGAAIAGRVEAVGRNITQFQPGDEVFGDLSASGWGGFAEYVCASEDALVLKPSRLSFEEAAAVPLAAVTALQGLRNKTEIQPGQKVLIYGASGGVGTFAVQIAKAFGAEVTAVSSTRHLDTMRSIGADHVIDYTQEDFSQNGQQYDLILAVNGDVSISNYRRALTPTGTYVMSGGSNRQLMQAMLQGTWISRTSTQKMSSLRATPNRQDLAFLSGLLQSGKIVPVIDRCFPLNEGIEAVRYLEAGHAKGKVVISVRQ
jgi:NADPH:quinone reductase-like Zn-dependent oxidoreductase